LQFYTFTSYTFSTATSVFIIEFVPAPLVHIDGVREPISGVVVVPTSNTIGLHFYPI